MTRLRERVDRALETALALLMAAMVANVLWQVATRFALGDPSSVTEEIARFALVWLGLLGAAYGFGRRAHLAVELLPSRVSGASARRLAIAVQVCIALFAGLVLVGGGGRLVALGFSLGQTSAALGLPLGAVYLALPAAGVLVLFYAVAEIAAAREP